MVNASSSSVFFFCFNSQFVCKSFAQPKKSKDTCKLENILSLEKKISKIEFI